MKSLCERSIFFNSRKTSHAKQHCREYTGIDIPASKYDVDNDEILLVDYKDDVFEFIANKIKNIYLSFNLSYSK